MISVKYFTKNIGAKKIFALFLLIGPEKHFFFEKFTIENIYLKKNKGITTINQSNNKYFFNTSYWLNIIKIYKHVYSAKVPE